MLQVLSTFSISSSLSKMSRVDLTAWTVAGLLAIVTVFNLHISMVGNVAHDALNYIPNYVVKLVTEGRWINFIFFDWLRTIPPVIAASLCNLFLFIFAYQVGRASTSETWCSVIFGLLVLNIPNFTMLFKWPMTLLPASFILALFALDYQRHSRYRLMLIAGIVMFATYPAFYFLVPLLFMRQLDQESWGSAVKFVVVWILGYILGYAFAQLFVYIATASVADHAMFIQVAEWRNPTPMIDLSSLLVNLTKSAGNFKQNILYLSELSAWFYLPITGVFVWALRYHLKYCLINLMVIFSVYASVVIIGVNIPLRTGITLPLGIAVMALLIKKPVRRVLLLVSMFIPFSYQVHEYNYSYNRDREITGSILEENDTYGYLKQPHHFKQLVITMDEIKTSEYLFHMTQNNAFKNIMIMENHYIKPHFNQYGWKRADIHFNNVLLDKVTGKTHMNIKGDIIYLYIR
ncbi:hypothetical protein [Vibrio sp. EJY3]|uniref:hypothetical protein n=1 Tax=Vibrio sp. (strain EJY3) TaxID=1116375 RepID=UPI000243BA42|nr:hypothetical protein [Vibrio sp. EJY3]AEX22113.1 hypothetical protein VEJY3_08125 [Vibrio sp. EJY3]